MEKKEKTSPIHGTNIFDPATLLGASPFSPGLAALPFAHVSHLAPAFSMLGHPAFPVTSLFGHLGDGLTSPLGIPLSLASSLSPTSAKFNPFSSAASSSSLSSSLFSTSLSKIASSSQNKSYTDTTPTATTTSSSSSSLSTSASSSGRGRRGRGGQRGGNSRGGRGGRRSLKDSTIPLSLMHTSALFSPAMLEKFARQSNGSFGLDGDFMSEKRAASSLFDTSIGKDSNKSKHYPSHKANSHHHWGLPGTPESPTKSSTSDGADSHSALDKVHIDSLKKKLIADQIRQRVQNKVELPHSLSPSRRRGRGRGRPPKSSSETELSPQEFEVQARIQERIKRELELELKQQQAALKMMRSQAGFSSSMAALEAAGHKSKRSPDKKVEKSAERSEKEGSPEKELLPLDLGKKRTLSTDSTKDDLSTSQTSIDEGSEATPDSDMKSSVDSSGTGSSSMDDDDDDDDDDDETGDSSESDSEESEMNGSSQDGNDDGESSGSSKRKAEDDFDDDDEVKKPVKRRHVVLDDTKIKIPLEKGWKRQTNIHTYGRRGIVGEVWYFAPCGRKMKTIPDVMRYLERHPVLGLGRDNFSFNTKVNVGEFYEARVGALENGFVKLTESEIEDRLYVTVSRRMKKIENQKKREKLKMQQILARQMIENKMKQKLEQQELARKVAEIQFQKRIERDQQRELLRRAKEMKIMEKKKQRDQIRIMREQERIQRDEQIRMKREMRAQQMLEKQRRKQEETQQKKHVAAIRKAEEREMKMQQANMLKEQIRMKQEQERRRQHMLLLKALEQRKRHEEREKQKRIIREKREEQRRLEFLLAQELKKPVEDMELLNNRPLPEFSRIPGNLLDGESFGDCVMCLEFLHNFAKSLGFDHNSLPTLKSVQDCILCKTEEDGEEYMSLVTHLLRYALDDPGVPNPKEAVTKLGQRIVDMDITEAIVSEVLRVFMVVRNGSENELSEYLKSHPLEACSVKQRAEVLVFLCNELNCSKSIVAEIDNHLEKMGDMRRDKWIIEGRLRRLRTLRVKKFHRDISKLMMETNNEDSTMTTNSKQTSDDEDSNEDLSLVEEDSDEEPSTLEECDKQLDKLQRQQNNHKAKSFSSANHVRAIDLGQDRYKRRYWVLPNCRGVFVEGMESGDDLFQSKVLVKCEKAESKNIKIEVIDERTEKKGVTVLEEVEEKKGIEIKQELEERKGICVKSEKESVKEKSSEKSEVVKKESEEISVKSESSENKESVKEELDKDKETEKTSEDGVESKEKSDSVEEGVDTGAQEEVEEAHSDDEQTDKHITEESKADSDKVVVENNSAADTTNTTSDKPLVETDQDKPQSKSISGNSGDSSSKPQSKHVELKIPRVNSSAIETGSGFLSGTSQPILQVPQSTNLSDFCSISIDNAIKSESQETAGQTPHASSTSLSLTNTSDPTMAMLANFMSQPSTSTSLGSMPFSMFPPPAHSGKHTIDHKPSFMSIDSILENKPPSSQNNNIFSNIYSMGLMNMPPVNDGKPWFSILPRVPCDDLSITRGPSKSTPSTFMTQISQLSQMSPMSQLPFQPFPMQKVMSLSSFQLTPSIASSTEDQSLPTTPGPVVEESFKKPDTPSSTSVQQLEHEDMLKNIQGEEKPIPEDMKKGWWRIGDGDTFQGLLNNLHQRGIREKCLHKTITKFYTHTLASANNPNLELTNLLSSGEEESSEEEEVEEEEEKEEEKKVEEPKEKGKKGKGKGRGRKPVRGKKKGKKVTEEVEEKEEEEEKMDTAETDAAADDQKKDEDQNENKMEEITDKQNTEKESEKSDGEKEQDDTKDEKPTTETEECTADASDKKKKQKEVIVPQIDTKSKIDEADRQALDDVEALEERVACASLQIKGWKLAPKTYADESTVRIIPRGEPKKSKDDMYPLEMAKERLLQLESNIERRYLKPPLSKAQRINLNSISCESMEDLETEPDFESLPPGLQTWRIAVATATSPAQLTLCTNQLTTSISWEKSIMKVLCQICRKDDNEAELLLCDGCDRGYHTYCFKPKLESIPEGDWYCFECVAKAAGETCCLVCGRHLGRMAECQSCSRCVHIDCLDPPLPRVPRKWFCASCEEGKGSSRKRSRKNSTASSSTPSTPVPPPPPPPQPMPPTPAQQDLTPTGRKRRSDFGIPRKRKTSEGQDCESPQKKDSKSSSSPTPKNDNKEREHEKEKIRISEQSTDLKICKTILTEMMKHEDGWPFLQPVNCKHFPSYRKYIKTPMDFGTMKVKLRDHGYTKRSEFVTDATLVFDNCELFNEDDSEVGQCGHNMKKYFLNRWREIILEAIVEENKS